MPAPACAGMPPPSPLPSPIVGRPATHKKALPQRRRIAYRRSAARERQRTQAKRWSAQRREGFARALGEDVHHQVKLRLLDDERRRQGDPIGIAAQDQPLLQSALADL